MSIRDFSPISFDNYFDSSKDIFIESVNINFRCYFSGSDTIDPLSFPVSKPIFVFFHGAGMSALTFSLTAEELRTHGYPLFSFDYRGHGNTVFGESGNNVDYSINTLTKDCVELINSVFTASHVLILVGHSLGGSLVTHVCSQLKSSIAGIIVVDVVEGSALESLEHMSKIVRNRPLEFESVEAGIKWYYNNKSVRDLQSARISFPALVFYDEIRNKYIWRTRLEETQSFWHDWFANMSSLFLAAPGLKVLILTGTDTLDTPLTIGQMQGKFQLVLLPSSGHCIQEDAHNEFVKTLLNFVVKRESEFMRLAKLNLILAQKKLVK